MSPGLRSISSFCVCGGSCLFLLLNLGVIGHVANGPGDNDLLHSDTAVGGLVGGGPAGHLARPLLDLPSIQKLPES